MAIPTGEACDALLASNFKLTFKRGVERLFRVQCDRRVADGIPENGVSRVCLERAIANQFSVDSALVGEIDFFGHQPVQHGAHGAGDFARVDLQKGITRAGVTWLVSAVACGMISIALICGFSTLLVKVILNFPSVTSTGTVST